MERDSLPAVMRAVAPAIGSHALSVGALSGALGAGFGGVVGIFRASSPALFSIFSAAQWFTLGTSFGAARHSTLTYFTWKDNTDMATTESNPRHLTTASAIGGATSGVVTGAVFRGRSNIIPGAIVCSSICFAVQAIINKTANKDDTVIREQPSRGLLERITQSNYWPMRPMSDSEYRQLLESKLDKINADLSLVDEDLAALDREKRPQSGE